MRGVSYSQSHYFDFISPKLLLCGRSLLEQEESSNIKIQHVSKVLKGVACESSITPAIYYFYNSNKVRKCARYKSSVVEETNFHGVAQDLSGVIEMSSRRSRHDAEDHENEKLRLLGTKTEKACLLLLLKDTTKGSKRSELCSHDYMIIRMLEQFKAPRKGKLCKDWWFKFKLNARVGMETGFDVQFVTQVRASLEMISSKGLHDPRRHWRSIFQDVKHIHIAWGTYILNSMCMRLVYRKVENYSEVFVHWKEKPPDKATWELSQDFIGKLAGFWIYRLFHLQRPPEHFSERAHARDISVSQLLEQICSIFIIEDNDVSKKEKLLQEIQSRFT